MSVSRIAFTSTLLTDGRVLVAGGLKDLGPADYYAAAEIYQSATGQFTATGPMLEPRSEHDAFVLPDGSVLIYGGRNHSTYLTSAEIYWP
jgi:hypothetical protein